MLSAVLNRLLLKIADIALKVRLLMSTVASPTVICKSY